ncbi:MAG: transcription initiation factor IIB family protein [Halorientalis sp.]
MSDTTVQSTETEQAPETEQATETESTTQCPECGGHLVQDTEHGETVCEECGLVVEEDEIDRGPEWRAFDAAEKDQKSRVGAPTTNMMHDKGLSTNIGWQDETASVIYRRALDEDLLPGRSIEGVATSALYAAARQAGNPRSIDEIVAVSRVGEMEMTRTYRYIVRELNLEIQPADPESYLPRFVSDLDLPEEVERRARELVESARERGILSGKSPVGLAAAAVYAAALLVNEKVTQSEVSEVANISEVTIRNRYKELLESEQLPL